MPCTVKLVRCEYWCILHKLYKHSAYQAWDAFKEELQLNELIAKIVAHARRRAERFAARANIASLQDVKFAPAPSGLMMI